MNEDVLTAAHEYRKRGWRVIALRPNEKRPVETNWQNTPPLSGPDVQALFDGTTNNVGIATGLPSGFWVLDLDYDKPGTEERFRAVMSQHGVTDLPPTRVVRTPGGGLHFYFAMPDFNVTNSARRLPDGVDVRGTGGQVVAPPSRVEKGVYTVLRDADVLPAPGWLLDLVRPAPPAAPVDLETLPKLTDLSDSEQRRLQAYTDRIIAAEIARLVECKEKGWQGPAWNQTTFEVSCTLVELANSPWCPLDMIGAQKVVLASAPRDPGFTDSDVAGCFASALKTVAGKARALPVNRQPDITIIPGDPLTDPHAGAAGNQPAAVPPVLRATTDLGNGQRMVDLYGDRLRWVNEAEEWATYEDGVWRVAGSSYGRSLAQDMVEGLIEREAQWHSDEPGEDDSPSERARFVKWALAQQASAKISAALKEASGRRELMVDLGDFDSDPYLLNVKNGVVDLRTGELVPHDPNQLMMLQAPVAFMPDAATKRWDGFLERVLPDPEVRLFLQKAVGYSLTGLMDEQAMFLHHGSGANGKSVFLKVIADIVGSYSQVVPRETLLAKGGSTTEHPTSVARMRGKRFLQASETAAGRRLDEETVKGLTGGEQQTARFMGQNFFDFTPTGKIHFVTNHLPRLTDAESIWRRLHLIGWRETIPAHERDPQLAQKIVDEEAEGVLAWIVAGAVLWYRDRLQPTASMRRDLAEYRTDQDILGEFISTRLEKDPALFVATEDVYGAYSAWCFNSGIKAPLTSQDLGRALTERGWQRHRTGKRRGFRGRVLPVDHDVNTDMLDPLVN